MSEAKLDTLTPLLAPSGAAITSIGSVTSTVGLDPIKIPMSTLRNADGTDGMAAIAATATATGTTSDTAWSGTGVSTIVAALKGIYNKLTGTLTTNALTDTQLRATPVNVLPSQVQSIISTGNSSSTNLAGYGAFTGTVESTQNQSSLSVTVYADQFVSIAVYQYDASGSLISVDSRRTYAAPTGYGFVVGLTAAKFNVQILNLSSFSTTQFKLVSTLGQLSQLPRATTQDDNFKVAINENNAGLATDAQILLLNKNIIINNILLNELLNGGKQNLNQLYADQTVTNAY
jgi:hypothetical protein